MNKQISVNSCLLQNSKGAKIAYVSKVARQRVGNSLKDKSKRRKGGEVLMLTAGVPFIELELIQKSWNELLAAPTFKSIFSLLGAIFVLLFGSFTVLSWAIIITTVIHYFMRILTKQNRDKPYNNLQLFIQAYLWLLIGNAVSRVLPLGGGLDGTLYGIIQFWVLYTEIGGIISCAQFAGWPIPPMLERIVAKSKDDTGISV